MTYRIRVEHSSRYQYANVVQSSFNEARITPLTTPWQLVLESRLQVVPGAALQAYLDYWGTVVHSFELHQPHDEMTVVGRSVVETTAQPEPDSTLSWEELHDDPVRDQFAEFLAPTTHVPVDPRLSDTALDLIGKSSPASVGFAAVEWAREQLTYVPGTTGVHTSAIEAWEGGKGVCQDFAHLTLALLRTMGVPSRYCSGYLHPEGDAEVGATMEGESHAWLEVWTGGWKAFDPTAGSATGERHVLVARGRDYADVPPIKGIFAGGPTAQLDVTVSLTRLA
jgi:transglutaminase-like putative cysteine protease